MVIACIDIEDRDRYLFQVNLLPADAHFSFHQFVALVKIPGELAAGLSGLVGAVKNPLFHAHEHGEFVFVIQDIQRVQVFFAGQPIRPQEQEQPVQELAGNITQGVHDQVDVQVPDQVAEQVPVGMKVHRRDAGHQVGDFVLAQGRVTETERPPLAHPQQVYLICATPLPDKIHRVVQVTVDVIIQGQGLIVFIRVAPVKQVNVQAGTEQPLDQRTPVLQVHDVRPVDQGVDDQDGDAMGFGDERFVVVQPDLVLPVHLVPGRRADVNGGGAGRFCKTGRQRQVEPGRLIAKPAPHGQERIHQAGKVARVFLGKCQLRIRLLPALQPQVEIVFQCRDRVRRQRGSRLPVRGFLSH